MMRSKLNVVAVCVTLAVFAAVWSAQRNRANAQSGNLAGAQHYFYYPVVTANADAVSIGPPGPLQVMGLSAMNNNGGGSHFRLYDLDTTPVCSSTNGLIGSYSIMGFGVVMPSLGNDGFSVQKGLGICISANFGATANTAARGSEILNFTIRKR